jgi:hypothetical protein
VEAGASAEEAGDEALTLTMVVAISLGLGLGSLASGSLGLFLVLTRQHRRLRNPLIIGLGYILFLASSIGSLLLLLGALERMGISRAIQGDAGLWMYALSFVCGVFISGVAEVTWRKSIGLLPDNKPRQSKT